MARPTPAPRTAAPPEALTGLAAVVALAAPAALLPARLAELSAQAGPFGLPLARGGFTAVIATEDPRAAWRYGRALPFPARILPAAASPWAAARAAALACLAESGRPDAVLVLPEDGAPIPSDLVFSLLAGLPPGAEASLRREGAARHAALRPALAAGLPEGGGGAAAAALARQGIRPLPAAAVPPAPPAPLRPGWFTRWRDRRADAA